jgi:hypothetical protein
MIITSNGKPMAILSAISPAGVEESLAVLRRVRALDSVESMQTQSVSSGKHCTSRKVLDAEIAAVRVDNFRAKRKKRNQ